MSPIIRHSILKCTYIFSLFLQLNKLIFKGSGVKHDWCHQDCLNLPRNSISPSASSELILSTTSNKEFLHSGTVKDTIIRRRNPHLYLYLALLFDHAIKTDVATDFFFF